MGERKYAPALSAAGLPRSLSLDLLPQAAEETGRVCGACRRDVRVFGTPSPPSGERVGVRGQAWASNRRFHLCALSVPSVRARFQTAPLQLAPQLMIPETQHFDALFREKTVSLFILGALVGKTVPTTIKFHSQLRAWAIEIEKVDTACVLAAELELVETIGTQQTPQALLGLGGFRAELAGEIASSRCASAMFAVLWRSPPHPNPLPRWGRGNFVRVVVVAHGQRL